MQPSSNLAALLNEFPPISPTLPIMQVADMFNQEQYQQALSIAIVEQGEAIGLISRYQILDLFINSANKNRLENQPVFHLMNPNPLMVPLQNSLEQAAQHIVVNMSFPLTEDFIITDNGLYRGIGFVLNLLSAMQMRVAQNTQQLSNAYQEVRSSQSQLIQSEKMASLGQMVAGLAHEMNTPLGYVKNNVEISQDYFNQFQQLLQSHQQLLHTISSPNARDDEIKQLLFQIDQLSDGLKDEEDFKRIRELFEDTLFGIDQMSELVVNLKNFSRVDDNKTDDVNINECIESALLIGHNQIKYQARVEKQLSQVPCFKGSASQINQVFLNLLNNAAQAIENPLGLIRISSRVENNCIIATVEDNGKGIAEESLHKIFDPFYTTKKIGEGTGLGLSISYKIVQDHGGEISVTSKIGQGSIFTLSIRL